jgi:N-succinyldiaminopimelate aminotransferase
MTSAKLLPFGTSIFTEMTRLAMERAAINLAQGFPDFDGPPGILEAAERALRAGHNQYPRSQGHPRLVEAIAAKYLRHYGLELDAMQEVVVFSGATEGLASSMLGLLDPGDEVILFEPVYDSYPPCVAMAGAIARYCTLRPPDFALDVDALAALFTERTRLVVLNTPHNPTGKVFSRAELAQIAALCERHDVRVLTDEVYEHLTFDGAEHLPIAAMPGMRERVLTLSSTGKTYSLTGWKIGWGVGPAPLVAAAQAAHQFVTFTTASPLQVAMAEALTRYDGDYLLQLRHDYLERRDFLAAALTRAGFEVRTPRGTYFLLADYSHLSALDDRAFARELIETVGVAAIPTSVFYPAHPEVSGRLLRFAFCKRLETLQAAAERLRNLRPR